jgi:hypothetical protein
MISEQSLNGLVIDSSNIGSASKDVCEPSPPESVIDEIISEVLDPQRKSMDALYKLCLRYKLKQNYQLGEQPNEFDAVFPAKFKTLENLRTQKYQNNANRILQLATDYFESGLKEHKLVFPCDDILMIDCLRDNLPQKCFLTRQRVNGLIELTDTDPAEQAAEANSDQSDDGYDDIHDVKSKIKLYHQNINHTLDILRLTPDPITQLVVEGLHQDELILEGVVHKPLVFCFRIVVPDSYKALKVKSFKIKRFFSKCKEHKLIDEVFTASEVFVMSDFSTNDIYTLIIGTLFDDESSVDSEHLWFIPWLPKSSFKECIIDSTNHFDQVIDQPDLLTFLPFEKNIYGLEFTNPKDYPSFFKQITCGKNVVALLDDGTLLEWGFIVRFTNEQNNEMNIKITDDDVEEVLESSVCEVYNPLVNYKVVQIASGFEFTLALDVFGSVFAWGNNECGQLGLGDKHFRILPTAVHNQTPFKMITAKACNCLAVDVYNRPYVWGKMQCEFVMTEDDDKPRLLPLTKDGDQLKPRLIDERYQSLCKIDCGDKFNGIMTETGGFYIWGDNTKGQLGFDYPNGDRLLFCDRPCRRFAESFVSNFSMSYQHTLVESKDENGMRSILGFGCNYFGQINKDDTQSFLRRPQTLEVNNPDAFYAINNSSVFIFGEKVVVFGEKEEIFEYAKEGSELRFIDKNMISLLRK